MKVSYRWLNEFVDIGETPQQLGTRFTNVGLAVDALESVDNDFVFELDVPTNRPDCLSHFGVAREVAAIYGSSLRAAKFELREAEERAIDAVTISISDPDLSARYCGRYIAGVKIGPSPEWLKSRLEALGVRSINNVADATNYVMLELGQPLHAFDADTLSGHQIIVRRAGFDEKMTTLDGVELPLLPLFGGSASRRFWEHRFKTQSSTAFSSGLDSTAAIRTMAGPLRFRAIASIFFAKKTCSKRSPAITDSTSSRRHCRNG